MKPPKAIKFSMTVRVIPDLIRNLDVEWQDAESPVCRQAFSMTMVFI
ncbi:MAG: hypothetical protein IKI40_01500 [Treponema sp.]|nr:hypothetical protein [Treponema sp.]